jgi:hypothetical protein
MTDQDFAHIFAIEQAILAPNIILMMGLIGWKVCSSHCRSRRGRSRRPAFGIRGDADRRALGAAATFTARQAASFFDWDDDDWCGNGHKVGGQGKLSLRARSIRQLARQHTNATQDHHLHAGRLWGCEQEYNHPTGNCCRLSQPATGSKAARRGLLGKRR